MTEYVSNIDVYVEAKNEAEAQKRLKAIEQALCSLPFDVAVQVGLLEEV